MFPRPLTIFLVLLLVIVEAREVVAFSTYSSSSRVYQQAKNNRNFPIGTATTPTSAASPAGTTSKIILRQKSSSTVLLLLSSNDNDDINSINSNNDDNDTFDMSELSRRIAGLQTADILLGTNTNNNNRNDNKNTDDDSDDTNTKSLLVDMPVVVFDSLLPNQRLSGRTSDSTFVRLLARLGLGGLFCMVSVNYSQRKIRRNGVVCRIELMNAPNADGLSSNGIVLTAVDFQVVGIRRCRVVGPPTGMTARIGRWRRCYDPDGEKTVLGFGEERFVDVEESVASTPMPMPPTTTIDTTTTTTTTTIDLISEKNQQPKQSVKEMKDLSTYEWNTVQVDCSIEDNIGSDPDTVVQKAESLLPLLEKWQELASDVKTYENTDVVVSSRVMRGEPGLRVDPAALLRKVRADLGQPPSPPSSLLLPNNADDFPAALAFWGAALINPIPALGASPEIRGRILEAPTVMAKLNILEWGINRSLANLNGTMPL